MAEYTANAPQTVQPGANILFSETPIGGCRAITHRAGSGLISLRGVTEQCRARFRVYFSGNIAVATGGTVGPIALAITIEGEPLASSTMVVTPAAIGDYFNVSSAVFIEVPRGCCLTVAVENVPAPVPVGTAAPATTAIDVENSNLIVERVA